MICEKYKALDHVGKILFIGSLQHACQTDDELFDMANIIIDLAHKKGLFKDVVIMPERIVENQNTKI